MAAPLSPGGLIVMPDTFMTARHAQVASLAARYRLPVITPWRFNAEIGGLISYGIDVADNFRRAADYADRILNGAKPSGSGPGQVRVGDQYEDRQGTRPRRAFVLTAARRRGD